VVNNFEHLEIEENEHYVICSLSNPPTHTLTSSGILEINKFLDLIEEKNDLRVLAFTGKGKDVFIKHYEVGELAHTAEKKFRGA